MNIHCSVRFSSVQSLVVSNSATPWIVAHQASLSITNSRSSPTLTSIKSVMPSSYLILGHPLLLLPPIPPSIRVFSNESTLCMKWPKHWSFSFSIIPSKEHPGLISFGMDWLDLLAVQGTLKRLLQHAQKQINPQSNQIGPWAWEHGDSSLVRGIRGPAELHCNQTSKLPHCGYKPGIILSH